MDDTWMLGSLPRRIPEDHENAISDFSNLAYRFHLNGNALYNYRDSKFQEFLGHVFRWSVQERGMIDSAAYDTDIASYLLLPEHWMETQNIYHRFRSTDMIRNYWHSTVALDVNEIQESSEQVVLVHFSRAENTIDTIEKVGEPIQTDVTAAQWSEFRPTLTCHDSLRVFGQGDGRKTLCGFRTMILEKSRPIVVYSFGSNNEDSFERAVLEECLEMRRTCLVYTFDPTSLPPPSSLEIETYTFFSLGLGAKDGLIRVCRTDSCKEDGEFLIRPVCYPIFYSLSVCLPLSLSPSLSLSLSHRHTHRSHPPASNVGTYLGIYYESIRTYLCGCIEGRYRRCRVCVFFRC